MAKSPKDAESMMEHGAAMLKHLPADAIETAKEFAGKARDEAAQLIESGGEHVGDLGTAIAKAINNNPVRAICVAIGIGCVLGIMFVRR